MEDAVCRTIFVSKSVDEAVCSRAPLLGLTRGALLRLYLDEGIARAGLGSDMPPAEVRTVMRMVDLHPRVVGQLNAMSVEKRIGGAELVQRLVHLGMLAVHADEPTS